MKCINCKNRKLSKIVNINKQPISSLFYDKPKRKLKLYPLDLYECHKCSLVQLIKLAPLKNMYGKTYGYRTSLSKLMINHMRDKFKMIIKRKIISKKDDYILDIGCNDGTFLNFFAKKKYKNLYGIDPSAEKFLKYFNKRIKLDVNFFSKKKINNKFGEKKFKLITSFAMFYDVLDPNLFCKDIYNLLDKNGIWILELSYLPTLIENLTYDQICHEHIAYYSLNTFNKIAKNNNLKIIDFRLNEINGGSIEIICAKKNSKYIKNDIKINRQLCIELQINKTTYKNLNIRIGNTAKNLVEFLKLLRENKKKIIGYGASTKGNILLNQIDANKNLVSYIADANPEKEGKFTPGTNIEIISKKSMRKIKPDYLIVLIWSFRNEVIKQEMEYIMKGGKLIIPLPIFHIIDKTNFKNYLNSDFYSYSGKI